MKTWRRLLFVRLCLCTLVATGLGSNAFAEVLLNLPSGSTTPVVSGATDQSLPSFLQVQFTDLPAGFEVTNQTYDGWCAAANETVIVSQSSPGSPIWSENNAVYQMFDTYPPSGAGSTLPPDDQTTAWRMVNWLLNNKQGASGTVDATVVDIQEAIWFLLQGKYFGDAPFTGSFDASNPTAAAMQLVSDAQAYGASFVPDRRQIVAVLLAGISQPGDAGPPQNLIFELKPAVVPWEMFHHDLSHTGLSPADTSGNKGKERWTFATKGAVLSSPAVGTDGTIYVGSHDHNLYAITPDGKEKWKFATGDIITCSPAVGPDGTIYIGSWDKNLYAVTSKGKEKWKFTTGGVVHSSPAVAGDGTIYVGSTDKNLYAVKADGKQKWKFATGNDIDSSPAVGGSEGDIYFGSWDLNLYAVKPDGTLKWKFATKGVVSSSPALDTEGNIYVGSVDGNVYAVKPDGTQKWKFEIDRSVGSSPALDADGNIYVGSDDGNLYAVGPDGKQRWKFKTGAPIRSSPAVGADGTIYVGSNDGNLYAVTSKGEKKWSMGIGEPVHSSPAIGGMDANVYIGGGAAKGLIAVQ